MLMTTETWSGDPGKPFAGSSRGPEIVRLSVADLSTTRLSGSQPKLVVIFTVLGSGPVMIVVDPATWYDTAMT